MDDQLQKLTRRLREERCPPSVLECVRREAANERTHGAHRCRLVGAGLAACALIVMLFTITSKKESEMVTEIAIQTSLEEEEQTVREIKASLTVVGYSLIDAGERTRSALSKRLKPRLVRGFEQATQTIIEKL